MPDDKARAGSRPRAKQLLRISLENAYAQLGVSPLASTDEISDRISNLRAEARRRLLAKAVKAANDPDEAEILRLQKIDEEIGDPKRRKVYDEKYPQNFLLTVQPSATEQAWLRYRKAGLISEWICDALGEAAAVPTPRCLRLWAPAGVDPAILNFLAGYAQADPSLRPGPQERVEEPETPQLSLDDLERFKNKG